MMGRPAYSSPPPSVVSDPTPRQRAMQLMSQKDDLEKQLADQQAILTANNCTMATPLVDAQGFPRGDIDVFVVRHARVRVIELTNDLKDITNRIGLALEEVHRSSIPDTEEDATSGLGASAPASASTLPDRNLIPFARVDSVAAGSPASESGLLPNDLLLQFGALTAESFARGSLQPLAALVSSHENRELVVRVRRETPNESESTGDRDLKFTPRKWGGRGLLGCHIVPR